MPPLPIKYVYSCPNPCIYHRAPLSAETPVCTKEDGVIVQRYSFPCYDHAQAEHKRKYESLRPGREYNKGILRHYLVEDRKELEKDMPEKERKAREKDIERYERELQVTIELEEQDLDTDKAKLKERWGLDPE